jgi:hypothetical protein
MENVSELAKRAASITLAGAFNPAIGQSNGACEVVVLFQLFAVGGRSVLEVRHIDRQKESAPDDLHTQLYAHLRGGDDNSASIRFSFLPARVTDVAGHRLLLAIVRNELIMRRAQ